MKSIFWTTFWPCFGLGLAFGVGIGVALRVIAAAPAPTFLWYLIAIAAGSALTALLLACFGQRQVAKVVATIAVTAAFWPAIGIVAAAF